jgi:hypothetical protein
LAVARKAFDELRGELEAYGACDPVRVEEKRRAVILAREAALRHTGEDYYLPFPTLSLHAVSRTGSLREMQTITRF